MGLQSPTRLKQLSNTNTYRIRCHCEPGPELSVLQVAAKSWTLVIRVAGWCRKGRRLAFWENAVHQKPHLLERAGSSMGEGVSLGREERRRWCLESGRGAGRSSAAL